MSDTFFVDWALWQKLALALAGAIVLTFGVAFSKLWYDTRRLRRYVKVADKNAPAFRNIEAQYNAVTHEKKVDEVPFGIRALESGLEVDGIWNSGPNTPVPRSPSRSTGASSLWKLYTRSQYAMRHLDLQDPANGGLYAGGPREVPSTQLHDPPTFSNRQSSALVDGYRYGPRPELDTTTARTSVSIDCDSVGSYNASHDRSVYHSSRSSIDVSTYFDPCIRLPASESQTSHSESLAAALDMLQKHRLSHIAETGQLTPRARRPRQSSEWASSPDAPIQPANCFWRITRPSSPSDSSTNASSPFSTNECSPESGTDTPPTSRDNTNVPVDKGSSHADLGTPGRSSLHSDRRTSSSPASNASLPQCNSRARHNRVSRFFRKLNSGSGGSHPSWSNFSATDTENMSETAGNRRYQKSHKRFSESS